jgi:hypothetical protein
LPSALGLLNFDPGGGRKTLRIATSRVSRGVGLHRLLASDIMSAIAALDREPQCFSRHEGTDRRNPDAAAAGLAYFNAAGEICSREPSEGRHEPAEALSLPIVRRQ